MGNAEYMGSCDKKLIVTGHSQINQVFILDSAKSRTCVEL